MTSPALTAADHLRLRRSRLRRALRAKGLDAFLATTPADVSYLSGFSGDDSYLLLNRRSTILITDSRFTEQARRQCPSVKILDRKGPIIEAVGKLVRTARIDRLGFEPAALSVQVHHKLRRVLRPGRLLAAPSLVQMARTRKDVSELAAIRRAIKVAQDALLACLRRLKPGMTELELAGQLELEMRRRGSSQPAFPTIVACGPRTSMPHVQPGRARLRRAAPILIDWGATVDGYTSDLTRVIFLGSIPKSFRTVYQTVWKASRAGMAAIRPGTPAKQVDAAARLVITQAGYGKYFGHSLGHGIGREVHESPLVAPRSAEQLEEGMVFTVEPGIYLPRRGGVRIENDVLVTAKGCHLLSSLPDSLAWAVRK